MTDREVLALLRTNADRQKALDEVRKQTAAGRPWYRCPNCLQLYPVDQPGASLDTCSVACRQEYAKYLLEEVSP